MAADVVESQEFRKLARDNSYVYGCLEVYVENAPSLDSHNFPNYRSQDNGSAMEKFLSLMQGLGNQMTSNDPTQKLPKTLPTVEWTGDELSSDMTLNGTMYFLSYSDYTQCKEALKKEIQGQGWTVASSSGKLNITSYQPTNSGSGALYAQDPMDAAGMAMMSNAMQHTASEALVTNGLITHDVDTYALGMARKDARDLGETDAYGNLAGFGFIQNMKAGLEAYGLNTAGGLISKWKTAGYPVQMKIAGQIARESVNFVMKSAEFTETAFVVDDTSGGIVYPTQMDVSLSLMNAYGSLLTSMTSKE